MLLSYVSEYNPLFYNIRNIDMKVMIGIVIMGTMAQNNKKGESITKKIIVFIL